MAFSADGRRRFLQQMAATSALLMSREGLALAEVEDEDGPTGPPLGFGVVGCGPWGREILETLARVPWATIAGVCDTYPAFLRKGTKIAPDAKETADYRELLDASEVEAIVVATPSHLHHEIVRAALEAGKHVYCEAPLASSVEEAKAIALAAKATSLVFQGGLQGRSNALWKHCETFVKSGVLGSRAMATAHWARKDSWRRMAPNAEREEEINWRLRRADSAGLPGEVGIHQLDLASTYLNALPEAVTGFGSVVEWTDGRDMPDSVQCVLEYPKGVRVVFSGTLASSVGGTFTLVQGSNSSLMMREERGWLIKEADSALLGWEVYARKEPVLDETGIAMIADSTKILAAGEEPGKVGGKPAKTPLQLAFEDFFRSIREDADVACGPLEAYQATVVAIQAHEASLSGERIVYAPGSFELA
jgi:predicted dehydrogenase